MLRKDWISKTIFYYSKARALNYTAQYIAWDLFVGLFPGTKRVERRSDRETLEALNHELDRLLTADAELFADKLLPVRLLWPEDPIGKIKSIPHLFLDGIQLYRRRNENANKEFSPQTLGKLNDLPEYYRRNFHFQSDGYLSERSARLYDLQVDMLFSGSTDAMRRMIVRPLLKLKSDSTQLRVLEVGSGVGSTTRLLTALFPSAQITAVDLSPHYVKVASERFQNNLNVHFLAADAQQLPFLDEHFDVVVNVFMFHEMPLEVREKCLREMRRVLKPDGALAVVDAIQRGDSELFDRLLSDFPKNYHEPFFKNYTLHPLEILFHENGLHVTDVSPGFASKAVVGTRVELPLPP